MSDYFCRYITECWGCRKMESHGYNTEAEYQAQHDDMAARGWRRKSFGPPSWDKGPWFCSEDCTTNSYNAKQAKEYWRQKEFEEYCKKTKVPVFFWLAVGFMVFLVGSILIERCFNAGL